MTHETLGAFDGAPMVYSYTRSQAIEDGVLIDAGPMAREAGWKIPVALTAAVWADCVAWSVEDTGRKMCSQDEAGRLWDVLWMAKVAARSHIARCRNEPDADPSHCAMVVYRIPRTGCRVDPELVELKIVIDGGDDGQPVATILQPMED